MKKLFFSLLILICTVYLSSCSSSTVKNEWFTDSILEKMSVPDLPEICDRDYYYHKSNDAPERLTFDYIEFKASSQDVRNYAREVYEYLAAQNFTYLGTRGDVKSSLAGAFATYYFKDVSTFGECYTNLYAKEYIFVYSSDTDPSDGITFNEILISSIDSKSIRYEGSEVRVNATIDLEYDKSYTLKDYEISFPISDLITGYWFFHSGIVNGEEVIIYDELDDMIVTPEYYTLMIFNDDFTGEYRFSGTTRAFTWSVYDETCIQVRLSDDDSFGYVTVINDERVRFTYGDLTIIYDK